MGQGILLKMQTKLETEVKYFLNLGAENIEMNTLLGKQISFTYLDKIHCIRCGRVTRKSFAQGYCYPCFTTAPETGDCILRPELCQEQEGISRYWPPELAFYRPGRTSPRSGHLIDSRRQCNHGHTQIPRSPISSHLF